MDCTQDAYHELLGSAARRLTGHQRRLFQAQVCLTLCDGSPRQAERDFGWGRQTVQKGLHESQSGIRCLENFKARGHRRTEDQNPQLAQDIRDIMEPHTYTDPELKSSRRYSNLTAAEVLSALQDTKGYRKEDLPKERTMRDILNRMNYRLKRIQKGKPLRKTKETDAIFANIQAVREEVRDDHETLEISIDTKAKVKVGEYSRGGKSRTDSQGNTEKAWDHDPPPKEKMIPFGVLVLCTKALTLIFSSQETSDAWVDGLQRWWDRVRVCWPAIKRLVIYMDNGPHNSGRRTQFLKRMVEFADWAHLVIRLVYYPPYHSKYNKIERCWSSLEKKFNGVLLTCWEVIKACALRMRWCKRHPVVERLPTTYARNVKVSKAERRVYEARLERSATLPKYDITINPKKPRGG